MTNNCISVSTMEVVSEAFKQETGLQSITRHLPSLVHSYHPTVNWLVHPDLYVGYDMRNVVDFGQTNHAHFDPGFINDGK